MEPLAGYLQLAQRLYEHGPEYAGAWNFGPGEADMCSVGEVVERLRGLWPDASATLRVEASEMHEAGLLRLDSSQAKARLGWAPRWDLQTCLEKTLAWHLAWRSDADMRTFTLKQLDQYREPL
jgi:CDP-glucose 4,6-dehydratase